MTIEIPAIGGMALIALGLAAAALILWRLLAVATEIRDLLRRQLDTDADDEDPFR